MDRHSSAAARCPARVDRPPTLPRSDALLDPCHQTQGGRSLKKGSRTCIVDARCGLALVLNIGVLGPGSEQYYLGSVPLGAEDYYLGGEVPGRWVGHGAEIVGLGGEVAGEALTELLADRDPRTGATLGCGSNRRVPAFDLTFSTPKSVSVLFGLSEPHVAVAVRDAHESAVDAALDYLERHAVWSRRGRNGIDQVVGDGLVGAAFRHRTSRAGDPHLHTHVLVANTVRGPDGNWRTLDFRHVYAHAKTAGYLYEAHLRHLLSERLGLAWRPVRNGTAELAGITDTVTRAFSTRRREIEAAMAARGETSGARRPNRDLGHEAAEGARGRRHPPADDLGGEGHRERTRSR